MTTGGPGFRFEDIFGDNSLFEEQLRESVRRAMGSTPTGTNFSTWANHVNARASLNPEPNYEEMRTPKYPPFKSWISGRCYWVKDTRGRPLQLWANGRERFSLTPDELVWERGRDFEASFRSWVATEHLWCQDQRRQPSQAAAPVDPLRGETTTLACCRKNGCQNALRQKIRDHPKAIVQTGPSKCAACGRDMPRGRSRTTLVGRYKQLVVDAEFEA